MTMICKKNTVLKCSFYLEHNEDPGEGAQGSPGDWDEGSCVGP